MKVLVAKRLLQHDKGRNVLAISGIFIAILLIFLQLGFYVSVPQAGMIFYDAMRFDLMLTSSSYVFEARPANFPRRRLYQALTVSEIARVMPVYHNFGHWLNDRSGLVRDIFVMGFNVADPVFGADDIKRQTPLLQQADVILVDVATRPSFGPIEQGRVVEIDQRGVVIGGTYDIGTGFIAPGAAITSDLNFVRIFRNQRLDEINLGLVLLRPGADANVVAARLRAILPADTRVFTREELAAYEMRYWVTQTSAGLIFGFGVVVAFVVGLVILHQTLKAQISRHLPQYATLKAMGYTDRYLGSILIILASFMALMSYLPAAVVSTVLYAAVRRVTLLPTEMTLGRLIAVLVITWAMSVASALAALRILHRADPADLFRT